MCDTHPADGRRSVISTDEGTVDDWLDLLAHRDRRLVLARVLADGDEPLSVAELTDTIADERDGTDPQSVRTALHHVHLPRLADADVVEYDADRSVVRYTGDDRFEEFLHAVGRASDD